MKNKSIVFIIVITVVSIASSLEVEDPNVYKALFGATTVALVGGGLAIDYLVEPIINLIPEISMT